MALFLLVLFVLGPIAEIYVLLTAGAAFGAPAVIGVCLLTAAVGGLVLRVQGMAALDAARADINAGRAPMEPIADGAFLLLAAPFLMTPGFLTDAFGFALLIPPVRRALARLALSYLRGRATHGRAHIVIRRR